MIFSNESLFSDSQNVTAAADSTNIIDLGEPGTPHGAAAPLEQDVGKGNPIEFVVYIDKVTTAADLTVNVITGASQSGGAISSPETLASTTISSADVVEGGKAYLRIIPDGVQQFLGLNYGGSGMDVDVTAGVTLGTQTNY